MNKEMSSMRVLFCFLFLHVIHGQLQINLYLTDWESNDENNNDLQHDCLHAIAPIGMRDNVGQSITYCMGEWPSKWNIQENNFDPKFTFAQLSKQNITSEQLYLWSAPMDVIENYQFYLNQLPNSENTSMTTQLFYNCTLPSFGPKCQYILNDYKAHHLSLDDVIQDFYCSNGYVPVTLTCYTHLECNRGPSPSCLDWSEICDGRVDCLDGGQDEEHCWQLEVHECNKNEYRCSNGQCIPDLFFMDDNYHYDCLDQSDEPNLKNFRHFQSGDSCFMPEPTFPSEDAACIKGHDTYLKTVTSSCVPERRDLILQAMFSVKPKSTSDECWTAFKCIIGMPISPDPLCKNLCSDGTCDEIIRKTCPDTIYAPAVPILLGHVILAYEKNNLKYVYRDNKPTYVCYNDQLLHLPDDSETRPLSNNVTCRPYNLIPDSDMDECVWLPSCINILNKWLQTWTSWIYNDSILCNKFAMYQCINSYKCISKHRLFDSYQDCFHDDDEKIYMWDTNCSIVPDFKYFKCRPTNECIPLRFVKDGICDCTPYDGSICDDERPELYDFKTTIKFQRICDNFTHLFPIMIDGENQTDETECDQWPCNNIYTRCDGFWNCLNGVDELNCDPSPLLNCPSDNHICVSVETRELMCLPIEQANDGKIDCIGATDEPTLCRADEDGDPYQSVYCEKHNSLPCLDVKRFCDRQSDCINNEDEQNCISDDYNKRQPTKGICVKNYELYGSDLAKTLCKVFFPHEKRLERDLFKLAKIQSSSEASVTHLSSHIFPLQSVIQTVQYYQQRCHRGLDIQVWLNKEKNLTTSACLCPPSFYGDICEFQNQRVSVTIEFRATSDSLQTPFLIIISLIDDSEERTIHSYEQFTYIAKYHCRKQFDAYLLYSTRPKNQTKQYSVHIDIYENSSLNYRGSVIKPLLFPFLPVHRLSFILDIPPIGDNIHSCSNHQCINGKCRRYYNDPNNMTFCQCNEGWSGRYCTIKHTCMCSSDSLCIGKLANNRSLCVCPLNKIGQRCLLNNPVCQINQYKCLNGGTCITVKEFEILDKQFICICPKGFEGYRCEKAQTKIIVSFDTDIVLPSSIGIHFIRERSDGSIHRQTIFKAIPFGQTSTTVYWSSPFNIVFTELTTKNYYLTSKPKKNQEMTVIEIPVYPSNRCLYINELFNETIVNYHLLRRIKYYHVPCQTNTPLRLPCFYDDIQLCLCQDHDHQHVANCLELEEMQRNCFVPSGCENGGTCFDDGFGCPQTTYCACHVCFYGTRCHLSTNGFSLSLDAILGYHIRPNINITYQPVAVLISLILSVIITLAGMINGLLTLITFKHKKARDVGCGIYLLCSSINTLLMTIIFTLKVWILVFSHMGSINNRSFLNLQCHSIDFLLRSSLTMDQWLTTCVAIERAYMTIKGIKFNKKKIKLTAKLATIGLILIIVGTTIHDPIHRRLSEEENDEEKRIWCVVEYPSGIHTANLIMIIFHIIVPFIINLISAIIIIIRNARQRAAIQKQQKYKKILKEQIQQHKNLLLGPCVLIILAIPRLIISFASGCMKSASDSWLFLLGYFISLIPPLLTFILFVLPSTTYYEVFRKAASRYRNAITIRS